MQAGRSTGSHAAPAMPRANEPWFLPEKKAAWLELATVLEPTALAYVIDPVSLSSVASPSRRANSFVWLSACAIGRDVSPATG